MELGADIHTANDGGGKPLHLAAYYGPADVVKMLVAGKADIYAANNDGWQNFTGRHIMAREMR